MARSMEAAVKTTQIKILNQSCERFDGEEMKTRREQIQPREVQGIAVHAVHRGSNV